VGTRRDHILRTRVFSSVFICSGVLFLAMMFVSPAVAAGPVASNSGVTDPAARAQTIQFGKMVMLAASQTYAVRMAAVFMMSLATIWLRTGLMPSWLVGLSYLAAVALLLASDVSMWITMAFPIWVLMVSGLLLARAGLCEELRTAGDEPTEPPR